MARVLVADDEPAIRELVGLAARLEGHTVAASFDTPSTVATFASFQPDLLLVDLSMPGGGGVVAVRQLRMAFGRLCPVIVITGYATELGDQDRRELGAAEILGKPVTIEHLRAAIRRALTPPPG
jgi:CheY-like chemotaxis protein